MKIDFKSIIMPFFYLTAMLVLALIVILPLAKNAQTEETTHDLIETVVTDKRINQGYCSAYVCYPTKFVLVSTTDDMTYTSYVSEIDFNGIEVGDVIYICKIHNKIEKR